MASELRVDLLKALLSLRSKSGGLLIASGDATTIADAILALIAPRIEKLESQRVLFCPEGHAVAPEPGVHTDDLACATCAERATVAALREAAQFFASGGEWGTWKAYMVHGPETKEKGISAAKKITAAQVVLDVLLAAESPTP